MSQGTLRHWEKAARESTYVCNQTAGLNKSNRACRHSWEFYSQNKLKGKSAGKVGAATEEFQYLMNFSTSITQCVAKAMELSDFAFVSIANVTLVRRDSYMAHVKHDSHTWLAWNRIHWLLYVKLHWTCLHCFRTLCWRGLKRILADLKARVSPMDSPVVGGIIIFTLTRGQINSHGNKSQTSLETTGMLQQEERWSSVQQVLITSG